VKHEDDHHSSYHGKDRYRHRGISSTKEEYDVKSEVKEEYGPAGHKVKKEGPNFEVSGLLAEDQNQVNGVALTFSLPPDSTVPNKSVTDWRLYEFNGDENSSVFKLHDFACFLFGKDKKLVGSSLMGELTFILIDNELCSRQHAVIQFRRRGDSIRPYLMDLKSTNNTLLNQKPIDSGKYIELRHQDVINFGHTSRDYVLLNALTS
jgi:smad nuclear-interacting protein 1